MDLETNSPNMPRTKTCPAAYLLSARGAIPFESLADFISLSLRHLTLSGIFFPSSQPAVRLPVLQLCLDCSDWLVHAI